MAQKNIRYYNFTYTQELVLQETHLTAMQMIDNVLFELNKYRTNEKLLATLEKHFHTNNENLVKYLLIPILMFVKKRAQYPAYYYSRIQIDNRLGFSKWCLPFTKIKLYPLWFSQTNKRIRAKTIIHEWMHRYLALLDLGYSWEDDYNKKSTLKSILNADSWASFIYDINMK